MAQIFISHSSANDAEAVALRGWLSSEGWDDYFLDLDPQRGIVAGERWERALNEAANRSEAVLFLVSKAWLGSEWCRREFHLAMKLNKRVFILLVQDIAVADLPAEITENWQLVNLAAGADHQMFRAALPDGSEKHVTFSTSALARLKVGLTKAGLDPRFFGWPPEHDPDRPPYRGLRPLEGDDAGIFFGREAPIIEALDRLRGLADAAPPRIFVVLGASGAGKSSFLRAGILPRLERDSRSFLVLPIVRPERAVITGEAGLLRSLETALKDAEIKRSRAQVKAAIDSGATAVSELLAELAASAGAADGAAPPRLVLSIDQGEELFQAEGSQEAKAFLELMGELAPATDSNLIVLVTIRSDSFEFLQTAKPLEGISAQTFSLPPLPRGAYQTVIEGPAARLRDTQRELKIEPALTEGLLADIEAGGGKDALPLLAFALERLYLEHGGDGDLTLAEYEEIGGIRGSIEVAVEQALAAADSDPAIPRDRNARLALLRRALIPWLAGIDPETGAPRRRVANLSEIPEEARPLVDHLVSARLLSTDISPETGERTIEPAHEALLRQWGFLQGWLEEDLAALSTLEGVRRAAREWEANARDDAWLAHMAGRLEDAEAIGRREDLGGMLVPSDRAYLLACRKEDNARRNRELEEAQKLAAAQQEAAEQQRQVAEKQKVVAHRTRIGLVAASILALISIGLAAFGFLQWREAETQTKIARIQQTAAEQQKEEAERLRVQAEEDAARYAAAVAAGRTRAGEFQQALMVVRPLFPRQFDPSFVAQRMGALSELSKALAGLESEPGVLRGHEGAVYRIAYSPNGKRIVTASGDSTARIWDAETGAVLQVLVGHIDMVRDAMFSPDGSRVLTRSGDATARIWDAETGALLHTLKVHEGFLSPVALSHDGSRVVTAGEDNSVLIWDAATGKVLSTLQGHTGDVGAAMFSPDDKHVLTASRDNTARIWDAETGKVLHTLQTPDSSAWSTTYSPDGKRVVTGSSSGSAYIWDAQTGAMLHELTGHKGWIWRLTFSPDSRLLVTTSRDTPPRVWDVETGAVLHTLDGHKGVVNAIAFSPDGTRIATASYDQMVRVWDTKSGEVLHTLTGHSASVTDVTFSPDGTHIATASEDLTARVWDAETGTSPHVLAGHDRSVSDAVFSPDGKRVVTVGQDKTIRFWDADTGAPLKTIEGHTDSIRSVAFTADGKRIVTSSRQSARIWDAETGAPLKELIGKPYLTWSTAFSPDGTRVVAGNEDNTVNIWDVETDKVLLTLTGHENPIRTAAFSPDGKRVVTASREGVARIWDAETGAMLHVLKGHEGWIWSVAFSPDGKLVATGSRDMTARIWNVETGKLVRVLEGHGGAVSGIAFSPDGKRIATSSNDNTARIWDAATGATLQVLQGHSGWVRSVAFSPDGTRVVTASRDATARIWRIGPRVPERDADGRPLTDANGSVIWKLFDPFSQALFDRAHDVMPRELSEEERREVLKERAPVVDSSDGGSAPG